MLSLIVFPLFVLAPYFAIALIGEFVSNGPRYVGHTFRDLGLVLFRFYIAYAAILTFIFVVGSTLKD